MPLHFHLNSTVRNANQHSKTSRSNIEACLEVLDECYNFLSTVCKIAKPAQMVLNPLVDWSIIAEKETVFGFYQSMLNLQFTCPDKQE